MTNLSFQALTAQLEKELYRLHYTAASILQYRRMWRRIACFLEQEETDYFTEEAGMCFLDQQFDFFAREKTGKLTQHIINVFRIVRMLGDFLQHVTILRRYYKHKALLQTSEFKTLLQRYRDYCREKAYSTVTQIHYGNIAERFLSFLESRGLRHANEIAATHLSDYINTLLGYSHKTVELELCALRALLHYLHETGLHPANLDTAIPAMKARKQHRIPSVWTQEHVAKLLEVIDRGNPAGKRDYAILLLVTRLGLRTIDIKRLTLANLKWQANRIELSQSKTAAVVSLPLLPDVGWAIIDYLQHGRPKVDSPYVFLRHLAPLAPFSDEDRLHQIIVKYMRLTKISISPDKKKGMHSLRHRCLSTKMSRSLIMQP